MTGPVHPELDIDVETMFSRDSSDNYVIHMADKNSGVKFLTVTMDGETFARWITSVHVQAKGRTRGIGLVGKRRVLTHFRVPAGAGQTTGNNPETEAALDRVEASGWKVDRTDPYNWHRRDPSGSAPTATILAYRHVEPGDTSFDQFHDQVLTP